MQLYPHTLCRRFGRLPCIRNCLRALIIALTGVAIGLPAMAQPSVPTLDPTSIEKFVTPLVIPPAMPRTGRVVERGGKNADYYEIAVRQFTQQILPAGLPATTVWGYGSINHPGTFNYPAFTIEAKVDTPVRVKWINGLVDADGKYLPHLLTVDQTLHWANAPGGTENRDRHGEDPAPYTGPVPMVTHVHGAHTTQESDGYPEAWTLPAAKNIPEGYATTGTYYDIFKASSPLGALWTPGSSVYEYPNDQRATTLWYHDHSLGMTRVNVYAGPAGFYLLRGGPTDIAGNRLPGPAPAMGDPVGRRYYEIPIVIQDRSFNADGALFYPNSREFFDGFAGPYTGDDEESDIAPFWNPEFFGNTIVVNGNTWPKLDVEQRRYRLRLLNGCQSRFLILKMSNDMPFWQIGAEGGFLPAPVMQTQLLLGPAERADVIVDFTNVPAGTNLIMENFGPDEPFGGGEPDEDFDTTNPDTTGQVMLFHVVPADSVDTSTPPARLNLPRLKRLPQSTVTRQVSLNELSSDILEEDGEPVGPRAAMLGTVTTDEDGTPMGMPMMWMDPVTENPAVGATEVWEIFNFTMDAHPIHIHQVMFEVVNRETMPMEEEEGMAVTSSARPPEIWETGTKDTVIAYPGEITRVKARFDIPGLFVWHCHILEHEDNEMMRPYRIGP